MVAGRLPGKCLTVGNEGAVRGRTRPREGQEQSQNCYVLGLVPTYGEGTHVSALSDQFLLLTLKINIKCITIDQFTGFGTSVLEM